jgi:formate dehydrogenase subunit delta
MDGENLIRMANRMGDFFVAMPDREEALRNLAQHIARFWEPRMRRQIYAMIDGGRAEHMQPIVAEALSQHREVLLPANRDPLPIPPTGESEA